MIGPLTRLVLRAPTAIVERALSVLSQDAQLERAFHRYRTTEEKKLMPDRDPYLDDDGYFHPSEPPPRYQSAPDPVVAPTPVPPITVPADEDRPNPLGKAAKAAGGVWAAVSGIVGALAMFGVLSSAQAQAIRAFGDGLPGWLMAIGVLLGAIIPAGGSLLAAFRTKAKAEPGVTPVDDPRRLDPVSGTLVPLVEHTGTVLIDGLFGRHSKEGGL